MKKVIEIVIIERDDTTGEEYEKHFPISSADYERCHIDAKMVILPGMDIPGGGDFVFHSMDRITGVELSIQAEIIEPGELPPMWWTIRPEVIK